MQEDELCVKLESTVLRLIKRSVSRLHSTSISGAVYSAHGPCRALFLLELDVDLDADSDREEWL